MATKKHLRTKHSRSKRKHRVTKKRRVQKRTKKHLRKNVSKRRKRYSKRSYYKGGAFNEQETSKIKEQLRRIGFVDGPEMDDILREYGKLSQRFGGRYFDQTIDQLKDFNPGEKEDFKEWLARIVTRFEDTVGSDSEDDSDNERNYGYSDNELDSDDPDRYYDSEED